MAIKKSKLDAYIKVCEAVSMLSPDEQTKVGAALINESGKIIALSYNGFVPGAIDESLPKTRPDKYRYMNHAERNLIYNCAEEGISTKNTTVVCTLSPCEDCLRALYSSGVRKVYFKDLYHAYGQNYKEMQDHVLDIKIEVNVSDSGYYEMNLSSRRGQ